MTEVARMEKGMYWDEAWSLVSGCTHVSPGCDHCWSAAETHMRANNPNEKVKARNQGLTVNSCFNGQIRLNNEFLDKPLRKKKPTVYAIWNDLFHEDVPNEFLYKVFAVMAAANWHTFLILTKRPERMKEVVKKIWPMFIGNVFNGTVITGPPPNVWLGVTAENQEMADKRIPILLQTPAAVRFVSCEPLLGSVDLTHITPDNYTVMNVLEGCGHSKKSHAQSMPNLFCNKLDWVICGGESGSGARPMHPDWARSLVEQCNDVGTKFFFKGWGEWGPVDQNIKWDGKRGIGTFGHYAEGDLVRCGKKQSGRLLDGREWNEFPDA